MTKHFDIKNFTNLGALDGQYQTQLNRLKSKGFETSNIEDTVNKASSNLSSDNPAPFVIYGEPQSGKTEMMICLSARLTDDGHKFIVLLLNDSVDLLDQNLGRFQSSGLAPSPKNFTEILDPDYDLKNSSHIVFCKKNARDLEKLIDKFDNLGQVIIIDDEADYASPNAKINADAQTKINELIEKLKGSDGLYVGVTATPARLDVNNTFGNIATKWIEFKPHTKYTGQKDFFPIEDDCAYSLRLLPIDGDNPEYVRKAFFRYLVASACLNHKQATVDYINYSMLVHTSGKIDDHQQDFKNLQKIIQILCDENNRKYARYAEEIWTQAGKRYPNANPDDLTRFIIRNISQHKLIVLNSKRDVTVNGESASNPKSLFTVVIGGNIVSRGVTFNNLLSMYFTRDVKNKIQQDTYIQRARMFGVRGKYLEHFELSIPEDLYNDWHRCFVYHKLSLDSARNENAPIWITDKRVAAVAPSSIDKSNVFQTNKGEMSFELFDYSEAKVEEKLEGVSEKKLTNIAVLEKFADYLGEESFPQHLLNFIKHFDGGSAGIAIYPSHNIADDKEDSSRGDDFSKVFRSRGFWGQFNRDKMGGAVHHFKIFYNSDNKARLFYRYDCDDIKSLRFIENRKHR
ncbi:MAG: DEAD/DEAH box helicase family protein [Gammaproteobacteria bacterium]|nr:DEAD/DEAH box helicase family protein [Gammaproteobacteria bacterium]